MHRHFLRVALAGGACSGSALAQGDAAPAPAPQGTAFDRALEEALAKQQPPPNAAAPPDLFGAPLRLLDLSLDTLVNAGSSTERDDSIDQLQGGGHDPKQRGFTLSQVELSAIGAVDPWFQFEAHLDYFITPEGESEFELEEAFARTSALPHGLQLKVGHYLTEFGRINAQHPHAWDFIDQPVICSRLFGPDGMRGTGARMAWLAPLPWFAELQLGIQNSHGETMTSFGASEDAPPPAGHAFDEVETRSLADFAWSSRLLQSFDLADDVVSFFGVSGAWGPNAAGTSTRSAVYGADVKVKWQAEKNDNGWPFVVFQAEALRRVYGTSLQSLDPDGVPGSGDEATVPGDTLHDRGGYAYVLWGFTRDWAAGLRLELARSSGAGLVPSDLDPRRDDRQRWSPLLVWHPSHFSRVRLQYDLDVADHLAHDRAHSVWLGLEFLVGSHPAHTY